MKFNSAFKLLLNDHWQSISDICIVQVKYKVSSENLAKLISYEAA